MKKFFQKKPWFSNTYRPPFSPSTYVELAPWNADNSASLLASFSGMKVEAFPNEHPEDLVRRFKRMVEKSGVLGELKKREYFISKGQKARLRKKEAIKNARIRRSEAERNEGSNYLE